MSHHFDGGGERSVVQELIYCSNLPGETVEVSSEGLQSMLGQVETELYHSATYRQVVSNLETLPTEVGNQVQRMVKAIGREAIRLAFRKLVRKKPAVTLQPVTQPNPSQSVMPPPPPPNANLSLSNPETPDIEASPPNPESLSTVSSSAQHPGAPASSNRVIPPISTKRTDNKLRKRLSRKERSAQAALQAWEERLRELGQELRQVRQSKSLSPYQLHLRTQIPLHQLEALEVGQIDRLPEDVYVRGFIRRVGNVLGLDGASLANSLPPLDPVKAILPTWYRPQERTGNMRSVHLYLGYAALMAGGVTWLSQQAPPKEPVSPTPFTQPATVTPPSQTTTPNTTPKPSTRAIQRPASTPSAIAPPETRPL